MSYETALSYTPLFHKTDPKHALSIVSSNELFLPLGSTNEVEKKAVPTKKTYYLSFARSLTSGYITDKGAGNSISADVVLVFDKEKLSHRRGVTFRSIDYWQRFDKSGRQNDRGKELEERMLSNSRIVKIGDSLKEVLIIVDTSSDYRQYASKVLFSLCKKKRIPVKLFTKTNIGGIVRMRESTEDRIKAAEFLKTIKQPKEQDRRSTFDDLKYLRELVYVKTWDGLSSAARNIFRYSDVKPEDLASTFKNDISNLRNTNKRIGSEQLDRMLQYAKVRNVDQLYEWLAKKWNAIKTAYYSTPAQ